MSLSQTVDLLLQLHDQGVHLFLKGEDLKYNTKDGLPVSAEVRNLIIESKDHIINFLKDQRYHAETSAKWEAVFVKERPARIQLSFSQERLWFIDKLHGSINYHIPIALRIRGELDRESLQHAFRQLINRHEILRTSYIEEDGIPYQQVTSSDSFIMDYEKVADELIAKDVIVQQIILKFDLSKDLMIRAKLVKFSEDEYLLIIIMHHIASDGWSMPIFVSELMQCYLSAKANCPHGLPDLPFQYIDYTLWQRQYLNGDVLNRKLAYWEEQLKDISPLNLPTDFARPMVQKVGGKMIEFKFDGALTKRIVELSRREDTTLFMTLAAVFKVMMYKYTGNPDICIGTVVANRNQKEIESLIGFFVNSLAIRSNLENDPTFRDLLGKVKKTSLAAYDHQDVPFEKVVERIETRRDMSTNPIFQVMFVVQNNAKAAPVNIPNLSLSTYPVESDTAKLDLTFTVLEDPEGLGLNVSFRSDLFEVSTIERMIGHYQQLITAVVDSPDAHVSTLKMLTESEQQSLENCMNSCTSIPYPKNKTLVHLFEEQVSKTPQHPAFVFEGQSITYAELNEKANQLAHYLILKGIKIEELVPICIERSLDAIIAIFGIMKTGAAFAVIDREYPTARINYIIKDTGCNLLITNKKCSELFDVFAEVESILIDDWTPFAALPAVNRQLVISPYNLLNVIYTSGSTGQPKGVLYEHRNMLDHVFNVIPAANFENCRSFALSSSLAADGGYTILFSSVLLGATVHVLSDEVLHDSEALKTYYQNNSIDCAKTVPSLWTSYAEEGVLILPNKTLILGGEIFPLSILEYLKKSQYGGAVFNNYGPTETTIGKLMHKIDLDKFYNRIPIGTPFSDTLLYVVDKDHNLCPIGVPGELWIGGDGVTRGYLNRDDLNRDKFIVNPFKGSGRLYRTGDIVKWLPNGELDFNGRVDDQVKIRGYRIELGEIESVLQSHSRVESAVVISRSNSQNEKELVAYIVGDEALQVSELRVYLKDRIPTYMLPARYMLLEAMPLSVNGKVNKKLLPEPMDPAVAAETNYIKPRNETEARLVEIWKDILAVSKISIGDNFFDIGGHSLRAVRLVSKIHKEFNVKISLSDFFNNPSVEELAKLIQHAGETSFFNISQTPQQSSYLLSSSQLRLWILTQFEGGNIAYNIPGVFVFLGNIDYIAFESAFTTLIARHEILRTVFKKDETNEIRQFINPPEDSGFTLVYVDLRHSPKQEEELKLLIEADMIHHFDLASGPLMRAVFYQLEENKWVLSFVIHHTISDGWSRDILIRELLSFYKANVGGNQYDLSPLHIQYKDYAAWQHEQLKIGALAQAKEYWLNQFAEIPSPLELPLDKVRPVIKTFNGAIIKHTLGEYTAREIKTICQDLGATLFMGLLAMVKILLYRYTGSSDITIGSSVAGRNHLELEDQLGLYVNTLALRTRFDGSDTFESLLAAVRRITIDAYEHQMYPFDELVNELRLQRDLSRNPLFDVEVSVQEPYENFSNFVEGVSITSYQSAESVISKFDLSFHFVPIGDELTVYVEYNTDLFKHESIERIAEHLDNLIRTVVLFPTTPIKLLDYLSIEEKQQLLTSFAGAATTGFDNTTVIECFEAQVEQSPYNVAVVDKEVSYSYEQLNARANQLAHYFRTKKIGSGSKVIFFLDRGADYLVSMIAVWKAGACFVPLDSNAPVARNIQVISQIDYSCILTTENLLEALHKSNLKEKLIVITEALKKSQLTNNLDNKIMPQDLAYIIFTSGSTGVPKGAMVQHLGMLNHLQAKLNDFNITSDDNVAQTATQVFDVSVWQFMVALLVGGTTRVLSGEDAWSPDKLLKNIDRYRITLFESVPAHFSLLLNYLANETELPPLATLRYLIMNGEALLVDYCRDWFNYYKSIPMANVYGPTECSDDVTHFLFEGCSPEWNTYVPVGKAILNTKLYVLDEQLNLLPSGSVGELYISGPCVGNGYVNNEAETTASFLPNKFADPGDRCFNRLYKTGDLVKWLPGGILSFIGRKDAQIKIRGNRVELGEIESILQVSSKIKQAVVLYQKNGSEGALVAYIVPTDTYNQFDLVAFLKAKLPHHMIPDVFIPLDAIPLTTNGKIDRKALPRPDGYLLRKREFTAPRDAMETRLVALWERVLNIEQIGIHDNFFDLGGHSLLVIQVISEIRKSFQIDLPLATIFQYATVAELKGYIDVMREVDEGLDFDMLDF